MIIVGDAINKIAQLPDGRLVVKDTEKDTLMVYEKPKPASSALTTKDWEIIVKQMADKK